VDSTLTSTGSPDGFFPNRHARLRLFTPAGVLVDQVAYGDSGGATVSSALPRSYFLSTIGPIETHRVAGALPTLGGEDSVIVTTSRLPDGTDTDNDAQDFGLSLGGTTGNVNVGVPSAPGTGLFFTRVYSYGVANDAVELYNPDAHQTIDFTGWFLSNGEFTQPIGIEGNVWSELEPFEKRILRRNEPGAFVFALEYDTQLALYKPDLQRVEQIAWWRDDLAWPDSCMTRSPETGGFHDGHDWVSSGGDRANYTLGPVRYEPCTINAPEVDAGETRHAIGFAGAVPNPASSSSGALFAFTVPGIEGGDRVKVRLTLYNVAGRRVREIVDHALAPGEHRARLPRVDGGGRTLAAGVYFAELEIGNARLHRNVVLLP
jgi:hypothetical protein